MEAKYIERLEQGVRVLTELPPEKKFDLSLWMRCGSVGCAIGWMGRDPWFNRRGFIVSLKEVGGWEPRFQYDAGWKAVVGFFGLTMPNARHLFDGYCYARGSRYDVIRRLKAFIRKEREAA